MFARVVDRWRNVSISRRLYFVVGIMAFLILGELLSLRFAMYTLSAARAFVGGEGLWSKNQKNAAISLQRYGRTKDESDFRSFLAYMEVPEGDHLARMELFKAAPDREIVRVGFLRGHIHAEDIDPMIDLLKRFYWTSYLSRAIATWSEGDRLLDDFKAAGLAYHAALVVGDGTVASARMEEIKHLNESLTAVEDEFSFELGAGSRWLEQVVLALLTIAVLAVETVGLAITFLISRSITRGLGELSEAAMHIGRGEFSRKVTPRSRDEIGQLAQSVNTMGQMLQRSYSDLEVRVAARTEELARSRDQLEIILKGITFLDEASQILASSMDYPRTLRRVGELSVPSLADWCAIDLVDIEGHPDSFAIIHADPKQVALAQELRGRRRAAWDASLGFGKVRASAQPELWDAADDGRRTDASVEGEWTALLRQLGILSLMIVPVLGRGRVLGALTFASAESKRRYTDADLRVAQELARRAGIAIENATLYDLAQRAVRVRDDFLSVASHELKTPLTSLSLQIHMARQRVERVAGAAGNTEGITKALEISGQQTERLTRLVEELLDVSRIRAGKLTFAPEQASLSQLVRDVMGRFADQLAQVGSEVVLEIADDVVGLFDRLRIEQVIANLLNNVIRYAAGSALKVSLTRDEQIATLVVADQGPGIAEDDQARIFERFEQGTSSGAVGGLGLGLFIVKEIVDGHRGSIQVESRPGNGTRFIVKLPLGAGPRS